MLPEGRKQSTGLNTSLQITGSPVVNGRLLDLRFGPGAVYGGKIGYFFGKAYHFRTILSEQNARFKGVIGGNPVNDTDVNQDVHDTDVEPGLQALAGARYFITSRIGLFGEYRFLHRVRR